MQLVFQKNRLVETRFSVLPGRKLKGSNNFVFLITEDIFYREVKEDLLS
jgi:hypothetical protein